MPTGPETQRPHNYYEILGIARPRGAGSAFTSADQLKAAYHQTLLLHHPDKTHNSRKQDITVTNDSQYSVDMIMVAYQTLADPKQRFLYDQQILKDNQDNTRAKSYGEPYSGVEMFDLENLDYEETEGIWSRACRCGSGGYRLTETDLDKEKITGEVLVGCEGCSLYIRILFGVEEEHEDAETQIMI